MEQLTTTLKDVLDSGVKLTPMMEQYVQIKNIYPDTILLFRMGDFYELFFDDAKLVSQLINISLTHRGKLGDFPIPMAGIPHHAAANYIDRLTNLGRKVVICDQVEDPKLAKGIVKRAVTQIVSPGMPFDVDKTGAQENRYIISSFCLNGYYYLSVVDFTTGDFFGFTLSSTQEFYEKILILKPKEFITYLGQYEDDSDFNKLLSELQTLKTFVSSEYFEEKHSKIYLKKLIPHYEKDGILIQTPQMLCALGALSFYISSTQKLESFDHLRPFKLMNLEENMKVSFSTLRGLEILPRNKEEPWNSLLGFMDKTKTSMGARYLREFFTTPLKNKKLIDKRLNLTEALTNAPEIVKNLRHELEYVRDLDRIMCKVSTGKATAGDLLNLSQTIQIFQKITPYFESIEAHQLVKIDPKSAQKLNQTALLIGNAINDEIGANLDKGNLIRPGFNKERDRLAKMNTNVGDELFVLEKKYREQTGINNLKIKSNNINGYFIEVSNSHLSKVPKSFQRRQTLVNNERYITQELEDFEKEIFLAQEKLRKLELELYQNILKTILDDANLILEVAKRLALIDVYQCLATVARHENFIRPKIVEDKKIVHIEGAWHPLIKAQIDNRFVPHHITLNEDTFFGLITGPNMAGKTTVMREVAIIQYLAQLGSFVPATNVEIGVCDYLFSRLGASDDIIRGQSTFMVEMSETAEILRHATENSLIILDEIGRGTSTYDGLSLAWALVEYFVNEVKAITLFATHYHELIDLANTLPHAKNFTVKTERKNGKVQFMYELIEGGATQSFGIHVAELAGIPKDVLTKARALLKQLEKNHDHDLFNVTAQEQLSLGQVFIENVSESQMSVIEEIKSCDLHNMTPIEALNKLSALKKTIERSKN